VTAKEKIQELVKTEDPPALGPRARPNVKSQGEVNRGLDEAFQGVNLSVANQQTVRALLLLWHDHLEASHVIAQDIPNPNGAFVHAIMHRREPDYSNAKYWFHRVGKHAAFPEIARRTQAWLKEQNQQTIAAKLLPKGTWDAFAFVDLCEDASRNSSSGSVQMLREIQRIETEVLLEHLLETNNS
jgi:hypothetical protein